MNEKVINNRKKIVDKNVCPKFFPSIFNYFLYFIYRFFFGDRGVV